MYIKYFSKSTFFYFPRISKSDQQRTHWGFNITNGLEV
jgi:hypothetical protein